MSICTEEFKKNVASGWDFKDGKTRLVMINKSDGPQWSWIQSLGRAYKITPLDREELIEFYKLTVSGELVRANKKSDFITSEHHGILYKLVEPTNNA